MNTPELIVFEGVIGALPDGDTVVVKRPADGSTSVAWLRSPAETAQRSVYPFNISRCQKFSYVTRVVRLAFLAPAIVDDVLAGRQAATLDAKRLAFTADLPSGWADQRKHFNQAPAPG